MLIGYSIRLNYQDSVKKELEGEFEVWGIEENNRFAKYTLNELGRMLNECSQHKTDVCQELRTTYIFQMQARRLVAKQSQNV